MHILTRQEFSKINDSVKGILIRECYYLICTADNGICITNQICINNEAAYSYEEYNKRLLITAFNMKHGRLYDCIKLIGITDSQIHDYLKGLAKNVKK